MRQSPPLLPFAVRGGDGRGRVKSPSPSSAPFLSRCRTAVERGWMAKAKKSFASPSEIPGVDNTQRKEDSHKKKEKKLVSF